MSKQFVAIFVVLAMCCLQSAFAIRCYQCSSLSDLNCSDDVIGPQSNIREVDCATVAKPNSGEDYLPVTKCNKLVASDRISAIITRGCHFEVLGQKPNECRVTDGRSVDSCYVCTGDLCNRDTTKKASGAATIGLSAALLAAAATLRFMY